MKQLIAFLLILAGITGEAFAQNILPNTESRMGTYTMVTKLKVGNPYNQACGSCAGNYWYFHFWRMGGGEEEMYHECIDEGSIFNNYGNPNRMVFPANAPVTQIKMRAVRRTSNVFGCNNSHDAETIQYFSYFNTTGCAYQNEEFIPGEGYVVQESTKEITITPNLWGFLDTLNHQSDILPVDDKVTFKAPSGFPALVYHWQYAIGDSISGPFTWIDFPSSYQGDSTIYFSATDLLGANTAANINRNINIRIKACGPPATNNETLSDRFTMSIRMDAPHVVSSVPQPTSCFDSQDGIVTVHFNRNLVPNEVLNIFFNKLDTVNNTFITAYTASNLVSLTGNAYQTPALLPPGKYMLKVVGTYFTNGQNGATFSGNLLTHYDTFYVTHPTAVAFTKATTDVWCHNGDDGHIDISATGGVGNYDYRLFTPGNNDTTWYDFATANQQTLANLVQGSYYVKIRDGNGCVAKNNGGLGAEITDTSAISQPADSIHADLVAQQQPTAYGFTNGHIHIAVYGGTPAPGGTYSYTWTNAANAIVTTDSAYVQGGVYHVWLQHLGADQYTVTIRDHQYNNATNKTGCEQVRTYVMEQPQPLKVTLERTSLPSCNKANTHLDPYSDAILTAHAEGGTPFPAPGLPYVYTWKKKDAGNNWVVMPGYTDSIASGLEEGWYAVNIEDAQGIQLAQYVDNVLVLLTDSTIYMPDHPLLTINEVITPVGCSADVTGGIVSNVAGGVPPYQYSWSTGDHSPDLSGIPAGGYFLYATDVNGCRVSKAVSVPEPDGYTLVLDTIPPTCHDGCDGSITLNLTGGTQPYAFVWEHTAVNTSQVNNLCAGTYTVHISDANNCSFSRIITLGNPPPIVVNMPRDTTLCNGQVTTLDISIDDPAASYQWQADNGFSAATAQVLLEQAGNYFALITDSDGCTGNDTFTLNRLQLDISADILLPTHALAGEEIVLVNVSNPRAEIVEWLLPAQATALETRDNFVRFRVNDTGTYAITLQTGINACRERVTRDVIVTASANLPGANNVLPPFIEDLKILPNPNNGHFTVQLQLREAAPAQLKVINLLSSEMITRRDLSGQKVYTEAFDINPAAAGTYLLSVETKKERRTVKIIVQ